MNKSYLQQRREFLAMGSKSLLAFMLGSHAVPLLANNKRSDTLFQDLSKLAKLQAPDANGVRLPQGFQSRIVARSAQKVSRSNYVWHSAPDGGACFTTYDGGWVYVSNSEMPISSRGSGGVGAVRFDQAGEIVEAYPILIGSDNNCAGGKTPWNTWLSCEEVDRGLVYECNPYLPGQGVVRPALGRFKHEAVAVDPINKHLFLTEDEPDGGFYRFVPRAELSDLRVGTLQIAQVVEKESGSYIEWHNVPDSQAGNAPARKQLKQITHFNGGEGIAWHEGLIYFTTKGDDRVWCYNTKTHEINILYDADTASTPHLKGVDNVVITASGDVLVAEDDGDMQIVLLSPDGKTVLPILQVVGHNDSEICGPAFDPSFQRLYFSSQRGAKGRNDDGVIFEISKIS